MEMFYLSTNAMGCNVTAAWKAHKKAHGSVILVLLKYIQHVSVTGDHQSKLH